MATIRVRDWTKARIEEIQAAESHSSHDSVIKTLLKDRQLAEFAGPATSSVVDPSESLGREPSEKPFEHLTVFCEMVEADSGVLFLWCPSCGNEIAHLTVENPLSIPVFEVECQRCLTQLDQHALVGIEIGYPLERRLVEEAVGADLRACVIDYWDRTLDRLGPEGNLADGTSVERLIWQFGQYLEAFNWDWPVDVPAVGLQVGQQYRDEREDQRLAVLERVTDGGGRAYRVRRADSGADLSSVEAERVAAHTLIEPLLARALYVDDS